MPVCETLYAAGCIQPRPFGAQCGNSAALSAQLTPQLGHALSLKGRVELDLVDKCRCQDERAYDEDVQQAHRQRPLRTSATDGNDGTRPDGRPARAAPSVRSAARNLAERARGLRAISSSSATIGRLVRVRNVGAARVTSGAWREPARVCARSARKTLTIRSSSE